MERIDGADVMARQHGRILVVEDDPGLADLLRDTLESVGYTVLAVNRGNAALTRASEADLVLLDIGLPDIDGITVCQTMRVTPDLARMPIIMLTARDEPRDRVRGIQCGADDYVAKPFDSDELLARIANLLRSRQIESSLRDRTRQLDTLRTLLSTLVNTVAVDEIAQRIVDAVPGAFPEDSGVLAGLLATVDDERRLVRAHAVTDIPIARQAVSLLGCPLQEFESLYDTPANLIEEVALTGQSRQANDLASHVAPTVPGPICSAIERLAHIRGAIAEPARAQGRTVGVFLFTLSKPVAEITATDRALMVEFAATAGIALENVRLYGQVERLALVDALTGVANRRHFDQALAEEVARARCLSYPLTLLMIDVDHFKAFNDTHGHQAGDDALRTVAEAIRETIRATDVVARYGGEEFAVLLPGTTATGTRVTAEKIRRSIAELPDLGITVSIGSESSPHDSGPGLIAAADAALYDAKRAGRNRVLAA